MSKKSKVVSRRTQVEEIDRLATRMAYAFVIVLCIGVGALINFEKAFTETTLLLLLVLGLFVYFAIIWEFDNWIHICQKYYFSHFEMEENG